MNEGGFWMTIRDMRSHSPVGLLHRSEERENEREREKAKYSFGTKNGNVQLTIDSKSYLRNISRI